MRRLDTFFSGASAALVLESGVQVLEYVWDHKVTHAWMSAALMGVFILSMFLNRRPE